MEFFIGIIAAVGGFFGGLFGGTEVPEPVVEVPVVEEAVVATTTETEESVPETPVVSAPKPVIPVVVPKVVAPVVAKPAVVVAATTTSTSTTPSVSSGGGSSSSSASSVSLSISAPKLSSVTEKDELSFTAVVKKSDGSTEDVTAKASWEVVGPIGSVAKGVFTAKLSSEFSEFGAAPGAVRATYQGLTAETAIFEVEAFVPNVINTQGQ